MRLYLQIDPTFAHSFWCRQYERGISLEASQHSIEVLEGLPPSEEREAVVCLIGSAPLWIWERRKALSATGTKGILLTPADPDSSDGFSHISIDYHTAMRKLFAYFHGNGKTKVALFGSNPSSSTDALKVAVYRRFADRPRVFENLGNLAKSCEEFFAALEDFDSVICCSDLIAAELGRYLRERGVNMPDDLWVAGFGDTVLAAKVHPSITTISCDYAAIGSQAVKIAAMLSRNPALSTVSMTIHGTLLIRESTGCIARPDKGILNSEVPAQSGEVNFYSDGTVDELLAVENLLSRCEPVDFKILNGISHGRRYSELADICYLSENAVKYRIKRMWTLAGKTCRQDLLRLAQRYLDLSAIE